MQDMTEALQAGDYTAAYEALQAEPEVAASPVGAAASAFLLALVERFDEAEALFRASNLQGFEVIIRGERQRVARWRDPETLGAFSSIAQTASASIYAAIATAFAIDDEPLARRAKAELAPHVRPIGGKITFVDGTTHAFASLSDADDAIGQMFEAYCGEGLLYFPFEAVRRVQLFPRDTFMDYLIPKARITLARGDVRAYLPTLYTGSALSPSTAVRAGKHAEFKSLGGARHGIGQRFFRADEAMVSLQGIAAIDFAITTDRSAV
ncbi:MAG TPA: type VI secretion system accessory protein TagJ [Kofleriaceae bacterium]|nr:type VI secretion system accessory protein TagJ [Kofleriaceae bacterium]